MESSVDGKGLVAEGSIGRLKRVSMARAQSQ